MDGCVMGVASVQRQPGVASRGHGTRARTLAWAVPAGFNCLSDACLRHLGNACTNRLRQSGPGSGHVEGAKRTTTRE